MMIAEAWRLLDKYPHLKMNNESLVECIEFLINESEDNMEQKLGWTTAYLHSSVDRVIQRCSIAYT
nr:hypothetical protein [Prevotella sp. CAG:732]